MEKVIVTGADGFVGSRVVGCLLENGIEVLAIGRIKTPKRLKKHNGLQYMQADVFQTDALIRKIKPSYYDTLIHFAWDGSAGDARVDYDLQLHNAKMTVEFVKVAKQLGCGRFVCAGSIMEREVIAATREPSSRPGMAYQYGIGKLTAHMMCKAVASHCGIDLVWAIITNAYGEGEYSPRFINTTIRKFINQEPLQFTSATQNYDFIHIDDVARAFYLIALNGKAFCEYVIGSGKARPLKEYITEMQATLNPEAQLLFGDVPFTGTNLQLTEFDTSNTSNDTGFVPEISFAEGIKRTAKWLKTTESI